jgi:hypothetical protein
MYSTKIREKSIGMTKHMRMLHVFLAAVVALILAISAPMGWAAQFDETEIFFEFNSTDLDLGLHIFFDAEGWKEVEVKGPNGEIFEVENDGSLKEIGSTEVFTESAEPPLCDKEEPEECTEWEIETAIAAFQALFPKGWYRFRGRTVEGKRLRGRAYLSHKLPAAPEIVSPEVEGVLDPENAVIEWRDTSGPGDPEIVRWEVVVEFEGENGRVFKFVVQVPAVPDAELQSMTVPQEFFESLADLDGEYKAEVLAIAESRNATITEREFELE